MIEQCLTGHRHTEFLQLLEHIDKNVPAKLDIHLILNYYATHKLPAIKTVASRDVCRSTELSEVV